MKIDEAVSKLIEKLRSVKWEVIDDDDWDSRCVFVDMRPDDFEALLNEAAAALEAARETAARGRQGEQTMTTNVQLVDELREVADWFRLRGLDENAALLDHAAHAVQCAANFFAWYNKHYPSPSSHPLHPWCTLGASLTPEKNDSARAEQLGTKRGEA